MPLAITASRATWSGPSGMWNRVLFSQETFWICVVRGSRTVS